jgi:hypothetical protein
LLSFLNVDDAFKKKHSDLVVRYDARTVTPGSITLSEVAEMKRVCEGLFIHAFSKRIQSRAKKEREGNVE